MQRKGGIRAEFDWKAEELQPFAKTYSQKQKEGAKKTVASPCLYSALIGFHKHDDEGTMSEDYQRFQVKALVSRMKSQLYFAGGGTGTFARNSHLIYKCA